MRPEVRLGLGHKAEREQRPDDVADSHQVRPQLSPGFVLPVRGRRRDPAWIDAVQLARQPSDVLCQAGEVPGTGLAGANAGQPPIANEGIGEDGGGCSDSLRPGDARPQGLGCNGSDLDLSR